MSRFGFNTVGKPHPRGPVSEHPVEHRRGYAANTRAVKRIALACRRYGRTVRFFACKLNRDNMNFEYVLVVAKRASGSRGGHVRQRHSWLFYNLHPEHRGVLLGLPRDRYATVEENLR